MKHLRLSLIVVTAFLVAVSCASLDGPAGFTAAEDPPFLPERDPDATGTITKVQPGGGDALLRILVEERPADRSGSLKDMVTITADTRIYREDGDRLRQATFDHLREGAVVAVWYDGAVRESYPRQANAVAIVIAN